MKKRLLLLSILCVSVVNVILAEPPSYIKTKDGIIVFTDSTVTGISNAIKLEVIADNIIRVLAAPGKEIVPTQSLVSAYSKNPRLTWNLVQGKDKLSLKTKTLTAVVDLKTGTVSFWDYNGKKIINEKPNIGYRFQPVVFDGKRYHSLTQTFQSTPDDAWYGLGQHQDGVLNYRGQQVTFFQNNTEVAVPFLVSSKNYGILWDNYSLTKAGDIKPFHLLSAFQLFSKKGEMGWLTASYSNDKTRPEEIVTQRAETNINMEFLGDSRKILPPEFLPERGVVTWEGSIVSYLSG